MIANGVIYQHPLSLEQLHDNIRTIASHSIFYAGFEALSTNEKPFEQRHYDLHDLAFLRTVAISLYAADEILNDMEQEKNGRESLRVHGKV